MNSSDRYSHLRTEVQSYKSFPQAWTPARTVTNPEAITFEQSLKTRGLRYEVSFNTYTVAFTYFSR